ncbi:hypothetical protein CMO94_00170 [Candidatus Woesearchaeota archaeon]|jgi:UDP-2-acetamido-3-amino-2,3-dideoxy-glucuronate N-acetyltransferase|nr:hypothetical protein [Candidatus Woesearchaeota archaeon]|tara:strand:+ start:3432 stop:4445 length:1014 start_codon:yes stop_codon:yes gene_type:complete
MGKINIGIIGLGRFGKNYLRTFNELDNALVTWVCATKESTIKEAISKIKTKVPIKTTTNYEDVFGDSEVDAVAIVTPGSTHFSLAKEALKCNKHVIVEKPLTLSSDDAKELVKISNAAKKILMVGHIHRFNPAIKKLKEDIKSGIFGKINYIEYTHLGNGPVRKDINALWDFFPHVLSILFYLLEDLPLKVNANGASFLQKGIEDVVTMDLTFPNNIFATAIGSWLYPVKKMGIVIVGEKLYATFDDYLTEEKLKYYSNNSKLIDGKLIKVDKRYSVPFIENDKPLTEQLKHFLNCIKYNKIPVTNGNEGLKVVNVLEAAQESLNNNGAPVKINASF